MKIALLFVAVLVAGCGTGAAPEYSSADLIRLLKEKGLQFTYKTVHSETAPAALNLHFDLKEDADNLQAMYEKRHEVEQKIGSGVGVRDQQEMGQLREIDAALGRNIEKLEDRRAERTVAVHRFATRAEAERAAFKSKEEIELRTSARQMDANFFVWGNFFMRGNPKVLDPIRRALP